MSILYELQSVGYRRGSRDALAGISVTLRAAGFVCLCGLNGAGKSTLLELMAGVLKDYSGSCRFEGQEVRHWKPRDLARRISFLPQGMQAVPDLPVPQIVIMGRNPFRDRWHESEEDHSICEESMRIAGCLEFRRRLFHQLSGGERQRVLFAATLAQQPAALLLDEPGTFVDLPHQVQMFRTIRELCAKGLLCVAATHDFNLAAAYASRMIVLHHGRLLIEGTPGEVLSSPLLAGVLGSDFRVESGADGRPRLHYAD